MDFYFFFGAIHSSVVAVAHDDNLIAAAENVLEGHMGEVRISEIPDDARIHDLREVFKVRAEYCPTCGDRKGTPEQMAWILDGVTRRDPRHKGTMT